MILIKGEIETWKLLYKLFEGKEPQDVEIKNKENWSLNHFLIHKKLLYHNAEYRLQNVIFIYF